MGAKPFSYKTVVVSIGCENARLCLRFTISCQTPNKQINNNNKKQRKGKWWKDNKPHLLEASAPMSCDEWCRNWEGSLADNTLWPRLLRAIQNPLCAPWIPSCRHQRRPISPFLWGNAHSAKFRWKLHCRTLPIIQALPTDSSHHISLEVGSELGTHSRPGQSSPWEPLSAARKTVSACKLEGCLGPLSWLHGSCLSRKGQFKAGEYREAKTRNKPEIGTDWEPQHTEFCSCSFSFFSRSHCRIFPSHSRNNIHF